MMSGLRSDELVKLLVNCDYCKTPLFSKMFMLKFANFERFFCCKECKSAYKRKNAGRMEAIVKKYQKSNRRNFSRYCTIESNFTRNEKRISNFETF